jgi:hypothetical protein
MFRAANGIGGRAIRCAEPLDLTTPDSRSRGSHYFQKQTSAFAGSSTAIGFRTRLCRADVAGSDRETNYAWPTAASGPAAMVPNYGHYVAYARPPGRVHRARVSRPKPIGTSGSQWLHEIKHDGFRIIARKTGAQVRLYRSLFKSSLTWDPL